MNTRLLSAVSIAALAACMFGAIYSWPAFLRSWLVAALAWGALPLGALAVLMTHGLTGGAWGERSGPVWSALAATMPLFAMAMLPLLFGLHELFSWMAPAEELAEVVRHKTLYLNEPFFILRTLFYLIVWLGLPWLLGVWGGRRRAVHAPGLILWVLTITFFGVDWFMSLEPEFYSDVFGLMLVTGSVAAAMAAGLLLAGDHIDTGIRQDLANLWLAVLLAWAFMVFAQLIIIWSGNLPHEIGWYINRQHPPWAFVGRVALFMFLFLPFAILLSSAAKRSRLWIRTATLSCLAGHVLYMHWLVLPAFDKQLAAQYWLSPAALIALGAGFLWIVYPRLQALKESRHD